MNYASYDDCIAGDLIWIKGSQFTEYGIKRLKIFLKHLKFVIEKIDSKRLL